MKTEWLVSWLVGRIRLTEIVVGGMKITVHVEAVAGEVHPEVTGGFETAVTAGAEIVAAGVGVELAVVVGDAEVHVVPFFSEKKD